MSFTTLGDLFSQQAALRKCSRLSLAQLLSQSQELELGKNELLFSADTHATFSYLLISGELTLSSQDGKQTVIGHGLIGEEAALGLVNYANNARATKASHILKIPTSAMRSLMSETPSLHDALVLSYHKLFDQTENIEDKPTLLIDSSIHSWRIIVGWLFTILIPICIYFYFGSGKELSFQQGRC